MTIDSSNRFASIVVGERLPERHFEVSLRALVMYAAATWDFHRIHYDRDFAVEAGFRAPVMDGQMAGALMASVLMRWGGGDVFVKRLAYRQTTTVEVGDTVVIGGVVSARSIETDCPLVTVTMHILKADGSPVVRDALAVLEWPVSGREWPQRG